MLDRALSGHRISRRNISLAITEPMTESSRTFLLGQGQYTRTIFCTTLVRSQILKDEKIARAHFSAKSFEEIQYIARQQSWKHRFLRIRETLI